MPGSDSKETTWQFPKELLKMTNHPQIISIILIVTFALCMPFAHADESNKKPPYQVKVLELKEAEFDYEIKCQFPTFNESLGPNAANLNKIIEKLIEEKVNESKSGFEKRETKSKMGSYLNIGYTVHHPSKNILSVVFAIESYSKGAAHPNHWTHTLTYDLKSGKSMSLAKVLNNDTNYLRKISNICIAQLKKKKGLDEYWIKNGAGPKKENYSSFFLDKSGIEIIFDEYKVGPYSAGPQSVKISYSKLKDLINPQLELELKIK